MKMAELIAVSPNLPGVLTRMGIPFGFGDETVEEVCRRNGTDPETFLLICSVYSGDGSLPAKERIRKADLKDVLKYLRRSHAYYMEVISPLSGRRRRPVALRATTENGLK